MGGDDGCRGRRGWGRLKMLSLSSDWRVGEVGGFNARQSVA